MAEQRGDRESITLGGGCFWCVEAALQELEGVVEVQSGYAGGHHPAPSYRLVCGGGTGHAEVVRVTFDPGVIPLEAILQVFFAVHDPTTRDRQGADVGPQYRSIVLYEADGQREVVDRVMSRMQADGVWGAPFVTEVKALERFFPAEAEHDDYFRRNSTQPYCQFVVAPKVAKVRKEFAHRLKRRTEA